MKYNILIVDDEKNALDNLRILLSDLAGCVLYFGANGKETYKILDTVNIDLLLTDINLPDTSGFEILETLKNKYPEIPVVIITAYSSWQTARDALKNGAFDYLAKPVKSSDIKLVIEKALKQRELLLENRRLKEKLKNISESDDIIGSSQNLQAVKELIRKVAVTESTVLITGESGTGKELAARAIHNFSGRASEKFVTVNCGAIPANLLESELFGFMKGSFTGAFNSKAGYFEIADKGTLFLDEIGELPLDLQVKILRVVEGHPFMRIGGAQEIKTDVRIVAATNRNLPDLIERNLFRMDLYYRLAVFQIKMPALVERKKDIEELYLFFINRLNKKFNKNIKGATPEALNIFMNYEWKGNVRELRNVIEHCMLIEDSDMLTVKSLPEYILSNASAVAAVTETDGAFNEKIENVEAELIRNALIKNNYNKSKAAKELGMSRQTLQYKVNKLKQYFYDV